MMTVTCTCGATAQADDNRSHFPPNWGRMATFDQKLIPLCPECKEKVAHHATEIYKLTGNRYPSISTFIRKGDAK